MNSKLDIRVEAVRMAVALKDTTTENVVSVATEIAKFMQGDVELPEHYDSNSYLNKMMDTLAQSYKPLNSGVGVVSEAGIHPAVKEKDED